MAALRQGFLRLFKPQIQRQSFMKQILWVNYSQKSKLTILSGNVADRKFEIKGQYILNRKVIYCIL